MKTNTTLCAPAVLALTLSGCGSAPTKNAYTTNDAYKALSGAFVSNQSSLGHHPKRPSV